MKEEILNIINNSNKKLDSLEIAKMLDKNSPKELRSVMDCLDELINAGLIRHASGNTYFKNDYLVGIVDMHEKGNAHVVIPGMDDVFIPKKNMNGACDKDKVNVVITNERENEGKIVNILSRSIGKGIAEVVNENGNFYINILDNKELPFNVHVALDDDISLVDGLLLKIKYERDLDKKNVLASVDYVIGHKNAPDSDTKLIAAEFDIPYEFSNEALEEAKNMPSGLTDDVIEYELSHGRKDFRNEIIFTIDGKDTKDIDDAVSVKILSNGNYELGVHIADVSHYVKRNSAIWKEAELRGNSNYLGDKVIPMLPIELSNGICSLNPNVDRLTLSCIMEIDHSGRTVKSYVCEGIIRSRKKMNYDAVEDIIEGKSTDDTLDYTTLTYVASSKDTFDSIAFANNMTTSELKEYNKEIDEVKEGTVINVPVSKIINNLSTLSKVLQSMKKRRGMLEFISDEVKFKYDENKHVCDIVPHLQRSAEKLIEDDMIADNEAVSTYATNANIPFAYRVHGTPSPKAIDEFMSFLTNNGIVYNKKIDAANISNKDLQDLLEFLKDKLNEDEYKIYNKKLLRCMQKAFYSPDNIGHFGIASDCYSHMTSPIRRFEDLCDHYAVKKFLLRNDYDVKELTAWASYLSVICEHVSDTERVSQEAEYAYDDMAMAEYMEGYIDENGNHVGGHIGEEFDAIIDTCLSHSFFVMASNYVEGRVDLTSLPGYYEFNQDNLSYLKNGKTVLRYGDKVRVKCISASKERRQVDFELVRKL